LCESNNKKFGDYRRAQKQKRSKIKKKNMKNYKTIIAAVALGIACSAVTSKADLVAINPGQNLPINDPTSTYTVGEGATLVGSMTSPYTVGSGVNTDIGTLVTQVYSGDANNPLKGLTFVYTESVTQGDFKGIVVDGFTGLVDVDNISGHADQVSYSPFGGITFTWADYALAGTTGSVVVDTSAIWFAPNAGGVIDNTTANPPILAPVPEPSTVVAGILMLLPFGIGAVRSLRKERA